MYLSLYLLSTHVLTTQFPMHALLFEFIDTHVLTPARYLPFTMPLVGEFWLPWILMPRFRSLELVDLSRWSEWRNGSVVGQRKTSPGLHPLRPQLVPRAFLLWLVRAFCTIHHLYISLYFRILRLSLM